MKEQSTIQKNIMRRVYYAYALRMLAHPITRHGALLLVCFALLTRFVSFPNVFHNMLERKLGEVHIFLFESVMSTEIWTLLLFAAIMVALVSLTREMSFARAREMQAV